MELITTEKIGDILGIGRGVFSGIKPLVIFLIGTFLALWIVEFLIDILTERTKVKKQTNITENKTINTQLNAVSSEFSEFKKLSKTLGYKLSRQELKQLKAMESERKRKILEKRYKELETGILEGIKEE